MGEKFPPLTGTWIFIVSRLVEEKSIAPNLNSSQACHPLSKILTCICEERKWTSVKNVFCRFAALDPAGFLVADLPEKRHLLLKGSDADSVFVIHTNSGPLYKVLHLFPNTNFKSTQKKLISNFYIHRSLIIIYVNAS